MKSLAALCLAGSVCLSSAADNQTGLIVQPYDPHTLAPVTTTTTVAGATLPQLRAMVSSNHSSVYDAAEYLIAAGDDATIARLVYALKQGSGIAAEMLFSQASIKMVPYLLEDMAHGSLKPRGRGERVRVSATEIIARALAKQTGLPAETRDRLRDAVVSSGYPLFIVPEKSRILLDWWEHNGDAVLAGEPDKARWLPTERKLQPLVFQEWQKADSARHRPPPPPPPALSFFLPLHVDESFEIWVARVRDPKKLDLTYASVDFETGKSVFPKAVKGEAEK